MELSCYKASDLKEEFSYFLPKKLYNWIYSFIGRSEYIVYIVVKANPYLIEKVTKVLALTLWKIDSEELIEIFTQTKHIEILYFVGVEFDLKLVPPLPNLYYGIKAIKILYH